MSEPRVLSRSELKGIPPHDLERCFSIFFSSSGQIRSYDGKTLRHVLDCGDELYIADIVSSGEVDSPAIDLTIRGEGKASRERLESLIELVSQMTNLRLDLRPFYERFEDDPVMGRLASELVGVKPVRTQTMYEALVVAILGQQISMIAASSIQRKLVDRFGESAVLGGKRYYAFPRPKRLAKATIKQLLECSLSTRKSEYIRDISRAVIDGELDLESLAEVKDSEQIILSLTDIRGIGRWTAEMAAIRGLARYDVVPADDVGLRKNVAHFYGLKSASGDDVRRIAESWGEWKGMATYYLHVASRLGLEINAENA
ncbi:MAG: hypothetical protein ABR879_06090 [Methanomassiliicoccales archaeon]